MDRGRIQLCITLEGNSMGYFFIQAMQAGLPDTLKTFLSDIAPTMNLIDRVHAAISTLSAYNQGLFSYSYNLNP